MNAHRRLVPEKYIASVLDEDSTHERTIKVKETLKTSPKKLHRVADKWLDHAGMCSLSRVMITKVETIPKRKKITETPNLEHHAHTHVEQEKHHAHADHHQRVDTHHNHLTNSHHENHSHGIHHSHEGHSHAHHTTSHDHHEHAGEENSTNHGEIFLGLTKKILTEFLGYTLKLAGILLLFGPTRTAIITMVAVVILNLSIGSSISVWISASVLLVVHLIFTVMNRFANGGGEGGSEAGHGGGSESHGGHDDHGHH